MVEASRRAVLASTLAAPALRSARAEAATLRIGTQFGIGYLPLYVAKAAGLIDAALRDVGLPPVPVDIRQFTGGPQINDGLLSGQLDLGAGGVTALAVAVERTAPAGDRAMKGLAALSSVPYVLMSNDAAIRRLADITARNRIGVPAVRVAVPSVLLEMAAAREFGAEGRNRFDAITVSLSQPDGATALITRNGVVDCYAFGPPFIQQLRTRPGIHQVWSSQDLFGEPITALAAWTTTAFHRDNPRTVTALIAALRAAATFIEAEPARAAQIYLTAENSRLTPELIGEVLADPAIRFSTQPSRLQPVVDFMAGAGRLRRRPADWTELFFPAIHAAGGS